MNISVFFWGGYQSTDQDMQLWYTSAKAQRPDLDIFTYAWPPALNAAKDSDGDDAVKMLKRKIDHDSIFQSWLDLIQTTQATAKTDVIFLVGHSSGCAIANAVHLALIDVKKITLVCLDGYLPKTTEDRNQLDLPTQVWSAWCGEKTSHNYRNGAVPLFQYWEPTDCTEDTDEWSLHFSLVNKSASAVAVTLATGYANCEANLCWLNPAKAELPSPSGKRRPVLANHKKKSK
jgi:hypothetical protein